MGADTEEAEALSGSLASFDILNFFKGLTESLSSGANNLFWRSGLEAELTLTDGVDLSVGWLNRHREETGLELATDLYTGVTNFSGFLQANIQTLLSAQNGLTRDEEIWDFKLGFRKLGPVSIYIGGSSDQQNLNVSPDVSEIVLPGGEGGSFDRHVSTVDGGATFSAAGLTLGASYQRDWADMAILRTDFRQRESTKIRAAYSFKKFVTLGATAQWLDEDNDSLGIGYDGRFRQYGGDIAVSPVAPLTLRASASQLKADTSIPALMPQNFSTYTSIYSDNGRSLEAGVSLKLAQITLDGSVGRFRNDGTLAFRIDRARLQGEIPIPTVKQLSLIGEWAYDKYTETTFAFGDYKANRVGIYARFRQ